MAKKPDINNVASGYQTTTTINDNFQNIRDAFDNTLSLDGSTPNSMGADFDMNGNDILNAGSISAQSILANGVDIFTLQNRITVSSESPTGGEDGDIWFKLA